MASGPEHYLEAERLAASVRDRNIAAAEVLARAALAQVHATLAAAPGDDSLRQQVDGLREAIRSLSEELAAAFTRIGVLEERLHDHEMAVPHAEPQS